MNCTSRGPKTVQYDFDQTTEDPTLATIEAIAAIENVSPTDLTLRLHDHIDPEALNNVVDGTSEISVAFSVDQYQIQVTEDTIVVTC